jgi:hypothetical protein
LCSHPKEPQPPAVCPRCRQNFSNLANLKRHANKKPECPALTPEIALVLVELASQLSKDVEESIEVVSDEIANERTEIAKEQLVAEHTKLIQSAECRVKQMSSSCSGAFVESQEQESTGMDYRKSFEGLCRSEQWRIEKECLEKMQHSFRVSREELPPILLRLASGIEKKEERNRLMKVAQYCHVHGVTRDSWPRLEEILQSGLSWNSIWKTIKSIAKVLTPVKLTSGEGHR